ncbi:MAG: HEAT repeat domain-containing protein [Gemmatimonadetes bacterium]|nr:HEAT repeat domain-containing protein [Gemmatimonadota bacterium]
MNARAMVPVLRAALVLVAATSLPAQSSRLNAVRDGQVRFTFTLRPGVCGQGQNIWRTGRVGRDGIRLDNKASRDVEYDVECDTGPGRVVIDKVNGRVDDVRFYVGGRWRTDAAATDLGQLPVRQAADLLLDIARTGEGKASERAIFPATLIDSVEVWRELIRLARDESRPRRARTQAVFWLGQAAEAPATQGLKDLVGEAAMDREVREQAVFALSQRPRDEAIPALVNIVRTSKDPELRKKALFWLGQSGDKRAIDLIEELLTRGK